MSNYPDVKPLPYTTYDLIVHFPSGIILLSGLIYISGQFENIKALINKIEITYATVDDIFLVFMFTILSYATGHIISSLSAELLQGYLDSRVLRPFDEYFLTKKKSKLKKTKSKLHFFSYIFIYSTLFPLIIYQLCFKYWVKNSYYDKFLISSKKNKPLENSKDRIIEAIEHRWDFINKDSWDFVEYSSSFHYIESLSKSAPSHHSEFVYGHLIQYSFARNMAFVFSILSMLLLIYIIPPLYQLQILSPNYSTADLPFGSWLNCLIAFIIFIVISISFLLRFLDQYKRYTREIYLAFVIEELKKEGKNK
ncbi:MAG: hypothetical protein ACTHJ4_08090 [Candidatus Nucleicultricaceae bacterium]